MTNKKSSTVVLGLLVASAVASWLMTDYVNQNLTTLPIEKVPSAHAAGQAFNVKEWLGALSPVLVESQKKALLSQAGDSVDSLFKSEVKIEPAPVVVAPVEPDYASMLTGRMHVDGIGAVGAFINGKFYRVGEPITDFEYPSRGRQVVPMIVQVKARSVVVKHGARVTELKM